MKTKILILGPLPPPIGGIATYVESMLKSNIVAEYEVLHINTARNHIIKKSTIKNFMSFANNILKLIYILFIRQPKIVHIHTSSYFAFWEKSIFLIISKIFFKKTVMHIHGAKFDQFYNNSCNINKYLIYSILKLSDKVIVLSMYWRQFFTTIITDEKICVIPNGINISQFESYKKKIPKKEICTNIKIIFLGNLVERKGVYDILSAIPIVQKKYNNVNFIFAGSEEQQGEIERLKNSSLKHGIDKNITFKQEFNNEEKILLLFEADIYILPSYAEGLPISLLEAMAAGLPVISTPVGGIPEVIVERENGFLINPGDYIALANKIIELIDKPELRIKIGRNNQNKVKEENNFNIISKKICEEYKILLT